jgi:hypothetical protein
MGRRVGAVLLAGFGVLAAGLAVTWLVKTRADQDRVYCAKNLMDLGKFAALYADAEKQKKPAPLLAAVPAGTVVNPALPPDRRLSWVPAGLLLFDQRRQNTEALAAHINPALPWDEGANAEAGRTKLVGLLCPAAPPDVPAGQPAVTQYVGLAGLGTDAATLGLGPPVPPRAGCFRYDSPTPLELISRHDGLSQSLLFAETNADIGPWIRGGPATVRGLDDAAGAPPVVGAGGQFGGTHLHGANFAAADGGVRFLTIRVSPGVLRAMVTIAGGPGETVGE